MLSFALDNASIQDAADYLSAKSKKLDLDKKGVNIIIEPGASSSAKPISLALNNVPLGEALRYICLLANVKYKVQDDGAVIVSP